MEDNYNKTYTLEELAPLGDYVVFPMIYENGVTYDDLVKEFSDDPRLFKLCRNLKVVKDKNFIIEVALKNNKAKVLSSIYQSDPYLQYVVTYLESEIFRDALEAIKTHQDLKLNSYKGINVGVDHIDFLNNQIEIAREKWLHNFFKSRTIKGYAYTRLMNPKTGENEEGCLEFNFHPSECYFGEKTFKIFKKLSKKIKYVSPDIIDYDTDQKIDQKRLESMFVKVRRKEFEQNLIPVFKEVFGVKYDVETLEQLADEEVEDLCKKADEGKIKI